MWPFHLFKKKQAHFPLLECNECVGNNDEIMDLQRIIIKIPEDNPKTTKSKAILSKSGKYSDTIQWRLEDDTLTISGHGPSAAARQVGTLAQPWMYPCLEKPIIRHVVIEEGITSIWPGAFADHQFLKSVVIPDSVSSIGSSAFYRCTALKAVTLSPCTHTINYGAFSGCTSLERVNIPKTVTHVGLYAFKGTPFIKKLQDKKGIVRFGTCIHQYFGTATSIDIPEGVKEIYNQAFADCKQLVTVNLPKSMVKIHSGAFENCEALQSVTIPASVKELGTSAFKNCKSLNNVTINLKTTRFDDSTFENTPWMANLPNSIIYDDTLFVVPHHAKFFVIPNNVKKVAFGALSKKPLVELEIPQSVEELQHSCCTSCQYLKILRLPEKLHMFTPHTHPISCCPAVETIYYGKDSSISVQGIACMGRAGNNAIWIKQNTGIVSIIGSGTVDLDMIVRVNEEDYADVGSYLVFEYVWGHADVEFAESITHYAPLPRSLPTELMREKYRHRDIENNTYRFSERVICTL